MSSSAIAQYEKLGKFFMGRSVDPETGDTSREAVLYDAKDLTTHAVIIGMTGSGKTGLGIGLIEEAAIDKVPVIAIDPKGDMGNLLLNFPSMQGRDLAPWVDPQAASNKGLSTDEFADKQAEMWRNGLADWDQPLERIQKLQDSADFSIYTPGSSAGLPVSVLQSFAAPPASLREDYDTYSQKVQATATSLLTLLGIDADPLTSREHILVSNILQRSWDNEESLDVAGMIAAIQAPPFDKIGVMDLESFYPAKDRFGLAMRINSLLASPGFAAWMQGAPLNARNLLYTEGGKPRVSVMSIAHLSDQERMFFVTMLLSELISWMRAQPGTGSLRAILYMDEIFGYMPPTANPPSKMLLLTLLKQARAFGVGLVLSTQNPVDLDYKGLSNTGTWFIGRLQTERDKMRVMEGLEGASAGDFNKSEMERVIAGLGKRKFLLHNVHESGPPELFATRWVMSYLAGPLTRNQIKKLMDGRAEEAGTATSGAASPSAKKVAPSPVAAAEQDNGIRSKRPAIPAEIRQVYVPVSIDADDDAELVYQAAVIGVSEVLYSNKTHKVDHEAEFLQVVDYNADSISFDWEEAESMTLSAKHLRRRGEKGALYLEPASSLMQAKNYTKWERLYKRWVRTEKSLQLWRSKEMRMTSEPGETEGDFRIRIQTAANEKRDLAAAKVRKKFEARATRLQDRLRRAEQAIEREQAQKRQKQMDAAVSVGSAIFGALFGSSRKGTSMRRAGSAMSKTNRIRKESQDVEAAIANADAIQQQIDEVQQQLQEELDLLADKFDAQDDVLDEVVVRATSTNIHIPVVGLAWLPCWKDDKGRLRRAC